MAQLHAHSLRLFDQCITDHTDLVELQNALDLVEKCCIAIQRKVNLATTLSRPENLQALRKRFGKEGHDIAIQLILRVALKDYHRKSFSVHSEMDSTKIEMLYRSVGGWNQFDTVLSLTLPEAGPDGSIFLLNPRKIEHWRTLKSIPSGTLVNVYIRTAAEKRSREQEVLAGNRYKAIFETIESEAKPIQEPKPSVKLEQQYRKRPHSGHHPHRETKKPVSHGVATGAPVFVFRVVISKMDTFVHAGNAQLILSHIREFSGTVQMYVLRPEKKRISMDADSIWSAEIRNGETVIFEFFGSRPGEQFLKELANKVNKYTQMDKLAHG